MALAPGVISVGGHSFSWVKLHGLLSWFDEPIELISQYVDGLARAGVSHVIALDGRYAMYPADEDSSDATQRGILDAACRHHGIASTVHVPSGPWEGGEVEKRTQLFALALALSDKGDWWLNADTDMIVTEAPDDLHARLAAFEGEAAEARIVDLVAKQANRQDWSPEFKMRCLLRAQPLYLDRNHYTYRALLDNHPVWSGPDSRGLSEALDLTDDLVIEHRPLNRSPSRVLLQSQYYSRRDSTGIEMGPCPRCGQQATTRVTINLRKYEGIPVGNVSELCDDCGKKEEALNRRKLRQWKIDPQTVRFNERYALPQPRR